MIGVPVGGVAVFQPGWCESLLFCVRAHKIAQNHRVAVPSPGLLFRIVIAMQNTYIKKLLESGSLRSFARWLVIGVVLLWSLAAITLVAARWIDPPTTAVHIERRFQAWIHQTSKNAPYRERYKFVPLNQISDDLQHAVIAAEDAHFYQHHGFDWHEIQIAAEEDLEGERTRGASTITQQLVKNLFFGTGRSILRKGAEATLVPVAELVLGKERILEIYLNVVEWGPGIYGAESACRYYDEIAALNISRQQAARLAAILPAPLKRRPERMNNYSAIILKRMSQMGW
ncbi:MAG TPA: monofunctional biosynthetic peptidoglycan transglycosylase [Terriglobales bacterium]|nr:monofunctional biosynthetic peptidoglycan transglycosylase [Terriglobales bacterium]